ncbi:MAG: dihydroorotate dehydrogenase electron transfer subunit [Candidatus Magasanikbacteria bacterium]|jgi:dihydroorotate dehydrogenase electron transfer subunit|nr:dihydroorotate dehydrogenase electron transfer subunit [Candidatus Magasanikbacteria bacterium]MBT4315174.1 dihydroorotate dehydrogenase electron transfer subunit [Candidatus Magasanikbacteria bacterium]MBT4547370.1 dihydroorotate dehydrogenase electron transfer subunit [Candidatus Magasanikbacteria bacterium]MBT6819029.1 dihydroorotate dehydrogenase electron transfer subunit [Candidatus Magasanikbacteria bacterium]
MENNNPQFIPISKIVEEAQDIKTFYFEHSLNSKPGQFIMLWVPEHDQKPFSIAYDDGKSFGLTFFKRGPTTTKLFDMKVGERVGIEGPFGTSFSRKPDTHYIMVAGGYGAAPLGFLAESLLSPPAGGGDARRAEGVGVDFCVGARNKDLVLFKNRIEKIPNTKLHIATDDGSEGHKGYITDILSNLIDSAEKKVLVVTCGPELMEKKILNICNEKNTDCEISIERYMKCGVGICGQCAVDPIGICMCKEGPVVKRELANKITEFGKYHRDKSGKIIYF